MTLKPMMMVPSTFLYSPFEFGTVLDALEVAGFKPDNTNVSMIPSTEVI